jgi:hypothetical protein
MDFLGKMGSAVQARKTPIGVHQADDECNASFSPPGVVDECREDKFGVLVRWSDRGDCDQDHSKRN